MGPQKVSTDGFNTKFISEQQDSDSNQLFDFCSYDHLKKPVPDSSGWQAYSENTNTNTHEQKNTNKEIQNTPAPDSSYWQADSGTFAPPLFLDCSPDDHHDDHDCDDSDDQSCVLMLEIRIKYQVTGLRLFPHCDPSLVESVDVEPADQDLEN